MILDYNGQLIKYGNDYIDAVYIESIRITKNPDKMSYEIGDLFDPTGMIVEAIYSDGSTKEIVDYTYSPIVIDSYGSATIEVSYLNLSDTLTVDVTSGYLYWDAGDAWINRIFYDYSYSPWSTAYTAENLFYTNSSVTKIIAKGNPSDTSASSMFYGCSSLSELDLRNFDTSDIIDMFSMFYGCSSLSELDLSNFDTSKVTNMQSMFSGCRALTKLDLSSFNTSNVTNMGNMFASCRALQELDLSNFDTSKVTNMSGMFSLDLNLRTIYVDNCDDNTINALLAQANRAGGGTFTIGTRDGRKAIIR